MAWHYGTFACGHEGRVQIYGPIKHREWKAERAFFGLCPTCSEEHKKIEREIRNQEAAEQAMEMDLPELTGTEKQVAWATTIRQDAIRWYEQYVEKKWYTLDKLTDIRHNRARGKHSVLGMTNIVVELAKKRWTDEEIGKHLGMDADEVLRLKQVSGIADLFKNRSYSKSWELGATDHAADI